MNRHGVLTQHICDGSGGSMWNLANILTLSRFLTAPVFLWLVLRLDRQGGAATAWCAFGILAFTLLTDMFDGIAARRQNQVTDFGKIMDPVADSTFFMTALFAFSASARFAVPIWMPLLVLYREVGMHVLRRYAALSGIVLAAKISGKIKMTVQSVTLLATMLLIAGAESGWLAADPAPWVFRAVLLIVAASLLSMIEYLRDVPALVRRHDESSRGGESEAAGEE